jgi:hypothetical protein
MELTLRKANSCLPIQLPLILLDLMILIILSKKNCETIQYTISFRLLLTVPSYVKIFSRGSCS